VKFQGNPVQIEFPDLKYMFAILIEFPKLYFKNKNYEYFVCFDLLNNSGHMISPSNFCVESPSSTGE